MNTKHLRSFIAVAEELNFRKAAERLHMTQPPLSQQIVQLEEDLGTQLFVRDRRSVSMTEAGRTLLHEALRILEDLERTRQRVADVGAGRIGRLRVGFVGPAIDGPLALHIKQFREAHPGVVLELHELSTTQQIGALKAHTLDMGVVRLIGHSTSGLDCTLYHCERYVLAVPQDHPLAALDSVSLASLDDMPMILFPRQLNTVLYDAWAAAFSTAGARMNITQEAATKHTSVALVAAGHGIAPVPASTAGPGRAGVTFIPLHGDIPTLELHLVCQRAPHSPPLAALLRHLCGALKAA